MKSEPAPLVEAKLLGCCVLQPDIIESLKRQVTGDHFTVKKHRIVFQAILDLHKRRVIPDEATLHQRITEMGVSDEVGGISEICAISTTVSSAGNWQHYARMLREADRRRRMIVALRRSITELSAGKDTGSVALRASEEMQRIAGEGISSTVTMKQSVAEVYQSIEQGAIDPSKRRAISCGMESVDRVAGEMPPGEFIVIGARPSMGKTALLWSMLRSCKQPSMMVSAEMRHEEITVRELSAASGISYHDLLHFRKEDTRWTDLTRAASASSKLPILYLDRGRMTVSRIFEQVYRAKSNMDIQVLAVDYLQLLHPDRRRERRDLEVAEISCSLKALATELGIVVLAASQVNRDVERRDRDQRPRASNLRESGSLEQDADRIYGLYRHAMVCDRIPSRISSVAEVGVVKNRNGPTGRAYLEFDGKTMSFRSARQDVVSEYIEYMEENQ